MSTSRRQGFTLVEILTVIAIICILFAIFTTVILKAKQKALIAPEIAYLRQLGQAAQMYSESSGDWPLGTLPLVNAGLVPPTICRAPADGTTDGYANAYIRYCAQHSTAYIGLETPYFNSFLGFRDLFYGMDMFDKYVKDDPGGGWLVSLIHSSPRVLGDPTPPLDGRYLRLFLDGSVHWRQHREVHIDDGSKLGLTAGHPVFMYIDEVEKWKDELCGPL